MKKMKRVREKTPFWQFPRSILKAKGRKKYQNEEKTKKHEKNEKK